LEDLEVEYDLGNHLELRVPAWRYEKWGEWTRGSQGVGG